MEFETVPADVQTVFGANSKQAQAIVAMSLNTNPNDNNFAHQTALVSRSTPIGSASRSIAHRAARSARPPMVAPDALPDEPGGDTNFRALFGNVNVAPVICAGASDRRDAYMNGHVRDY